MFRRLLDPGPTTAATSLALLVLRASLGMTMLMLHGWMKVVNVSTLSARFADPYGIGQTPSLLLSIVAELVCAGLLAAGLATRPAALALVINMVTAWVYGHGMKLSGPGSGELAFVYLAGFTAVLLGGPGRFSLDQLLFGGRSRR